MKSWRPEISLVGNRQRVTAAELNQKLLFGLQSEGETTKPFSTQMNIPKEEQ